MTRPPPAASPPTIVVAHPSADLYGSDRQLLESVTALVDAGWRVVTVVPDAGSLVGRLQAAGSSTRVLRTPVLRKAALRPRGFLELLRSFGSVPAMVRLLRRARPSVVYVNTVTIPVWLVLARILGIAAVCHVHEAEENLPRVIRFALAVPLVFARRLITNSRTTLSVLTRDLPFVRRRCRVIYNGVPGPPEPTPLTTRPPQRLHVCLVGRLSPRKGSHVALEAVGLLRREGVDVTLELVGDVFPGYEWFEAELRASAAPLGTHVTFTGFVEDVWGAYARADIAIMPSWGESFGNVAVEAMLAQRPVIASRVQGLTEIIDDGVTGVLVPPDDAPALAAAIRSLHGDWHRTVEMARAGQAHAQRNFTTERYRREIVRTIAALVRGPAATRRRSE